MLTYTAGVLNVSNVISIVFARFAFGFIGTSVSKTVCSSGATRSSLKNASCQIFYIPFQLVTTPCSIGYCNISTNASTAICFVIEEHLEQRRLNHHKPFSEDKRHRHLPFLP